MDITIALYDVLDAFWRMGGEDREDMASGALPNARRSPRGEVALAYACHTLRLRLANGRHAPDRRRLDCDGHLGRPRRPATAATCA